jgi:hypothetical protein
MKLRSSREVRPSPANKFSVTANIAPFVSHFVGLHSAGAAFAFDGARFAS